MLSSAALFRERQRNSRGNHYSHKGPSTFSQTKEPVLSLACRVGNGTGLSGSAAAASRTSLESQSARRRAFARRSDGQRPDGIRRGYHALDDSTGSRIRPPCRLLPISRIFICLGTVLRAKSNSAIRGGARLPTRCDWFGQLFDRNLFSSLRRDPRAMDCCREADGTAMGLVADR